MSIMVCIKYPLTFSIALCDHTLTFLGILFFSLLHDKSFSLHFFLHFVHFHFTSLTIVLSSLSLHFHSLFHFHSFLHCSLSSSFALASYLLHTHFMFVFIYKLVLVAITLCSFCCWFLIANCALLPS